MSLLRVTFTLESESCDSAICFPYQRSFHPHQGQWDSEAAVNNPGKLFSSRATQRCCHPSALTAPPLQHVNQGHYQKPSPSSSISKHSDAAVLRGEHLSAIPVSRQSSDLPTASGEEKAKPHCVPPKGLSLFAARAGAVKRGTS